jgi:beta-alanine--pyruvate transaminase
MGGVAVREGVHRTLMDNADAPIELFHGYTYSGHPLACAAGLATLDIFEEEGLVARAADLSPRFEDAIHGLRGTRHVVDIRNLGLMAGIELEPRPGAPGARVMEAFEACFDQGVLVRVTGDIIALSPPLILQQGHVDRIADTLRSVFDALD